MAKLKCDHCEDKPATCVGRYEGLPLMAACDECCGHGNEDGACWELVQTDEVRGLGIADCGDNGGAV